MIDTLLSWLGDPEVAARIRTRIRRDTPAYARFATEAEEAEWSRNIDNGLALFIRCAAEDRGVTHTERASMEAIGRRRAEQNAVSLDAMDASLHTAVSETLDYVLERIPTFGAAEREALLTLSRRLARYGNEISAAAINAFLVEKEAMATRRVRGGSRLFEEILGGRHAADDMTALAASQGIDLAAAWQAALVPTGVTGNDALQECESQLLASLPDAVPVSMAAAATPHSVIMFRSLSSRSDTEDALRLAAETRHATILRFGPCVGVEQMRHRYVTARSLLPYLRRLADGAHLLHAEEFSEVALITGADSEVKEAFLRDVLGSLMAIRPQVRARVLRTAEAVTRIGTAQGALALHLGVDVKTVRRHLRLIEEATGLCLDRFDHVRRIGLAFQLQKTVGVSARG